MEKAEKSDHSRKTFIMVFFAFALGMILSSLLSQKPLTAPSDREQVLITYRGIDQTIADLPEGLASEYCARQAETQAQQIKLLSSAAISFYVTEHAAKEGVSFEQALNTLFPISQPDEAQVSEFYQNNREALKHQPYYEVKDDIVAWLQKAQARQLRHAVLARLVDQSDVIFWPDQPRLSCQTGSKAAETGKSDA